MKLGGGGGGGISLDVQFELTFLLIDNLFVKKFLCNIVRHIQFIDKYWISYTGAYQMWYEIFFVMPSLYEFPCDFYFKQDRRWNAENPSATLDP